MARNLATKFSEMSKLQPRASARAVRPQIFRNFRKFPVMFGMRQSYSTYPPAYQLTIRCYGTRLHGCAEGSVSRYQNEYGTPTIKPDDELLETMRQRMKQKPYSLDQPRRSIVRDSVIEVCRYRKWSLFALHIRTNHLHSVVGAPSPPEPVMDDFKEYSSRNLNRARIDPEKRRRWARHGSTDYLWTRERFSWSIEICGILDGGVCRCKDHEGRVWD